MKKVYIYIYISFFVHGNLYLKKEKAIEDGNLHLLPQLNKDIKRYARLDKETAAIRQLEEADAQGCKWEGLKATRETFQPRRTKESDFADEAATYLETVHHPQMMTLTSQTKTNIFFLEIHL